MSTFFATLLDLLHVLAWMVKPKEASMASVTTFWEAASYAASCASSSVVILGKSSIVAVEAVAIVGSFLRGAESELQHVARNQTTIDLRRGCAPAFQEWEPFLFYQVRISSASDDTSSCN